MEENEVEEEEKKKKTAEAGESTGLNVVYIFFSSFRGAGELHKLSGAPFFNGLRREGSYITWPEQAECFHSSVSPR